MIWSNSSNLQIRNGGKFWIKSGATLDENGQDAGANLVFLDNGTDAELLNEGYALIGRITVSNSNGTVTINGTKEITLTDDIRFGADNVNLINNAVLDILDDIDFDNWSGVIENYGTISIADDINDPGAGEVSYYNYTGSYSYWGNFNGTGFTNLMLYADYDSNLVSYNQGGADDDQIILTPQDAYWNLTLSTSGTKTSNGDLDINGNLSIEDLAQLNVSTNSNNINLAGNWIVTSTNGNPFSQGNESVTFDGTAKQTLSTVLAAGETFYNLQLSNAGEGLELQTSNITMTNSLTMNSGNIEAGTNTVYLNNTSGDPTDLVHSDGQIVGKFRRNINNTYAGQDYKFPVGTSSNENSATFNFNSVTTPGSLTVEFKIGDPGGTGVPGVGENVINYYTDGYWDLTPTSLVVGNYDLDLVANGFTSETFNSSVRILKRDNGGIWTLDGSHAAATDPPPIAHRTTLSTGISALTSQYCIGQTDCIDITTHPVSQTSCTGGSVTFTVAGTTSDPPLTYQWKKDGVNLGGETGSSLVINPVSDSDAGSYTCLVGGQSCGSALSSPATLSILEPFAGLGYAYKKTITIDPNNVKGTSNLINFPVLISVTDADLATTANGGYVENASGYDIVFTDDQGYKLDHQVEKYVPTTGEYIAWVRVSALSYNADTKIDIIYGNPAISTDPSSSATWDGYLGVWHLEDFVDATGQNADGTNYSSTAATGVISSGREFNGSSRITVPQDILLEPADGITVSLWVRRNGAQNNWAKPIWYAQNNNDPWGPYGFEFNNTSDNILDFHLADAGRK